MTNRFDVALVEQSKAYAPDPRYREEAWMKDYTDAYRAFLESPESFWDKQAREIAWSKPYEKVLEWDYPHAKWFSGGRLNVTTSCLDRHVAGGRKNRAALIWQGERSEERTYTYQQLARAVERCAAGLASLGIGKGDRVCIYMPLVPEQVIAMLACARIGAVHSVIFGGFGAGALRMRINDAGAKAVITADVGYRRGKVIPLKAIVDEAVVDAPTVERIVVFRRRDPSIELHSEMEVDWNELLSSGSARCPPVEMDAEDPLFILYTSGSTGTPKGVVHACGGYLVGTHYTAKHVFDLKDDDIYWCTADPGWITGHSYLVYGPLAVGATCFMTECAPDYPDPGSWWRIVERQGITIFYTAPTAIRMFMRLGEEWPGKYDLSSLRILGSVGEPLNPEAFEWYYQVIGGRRIPIVDTWWQTETGMQMITTMVGERMKPGFAGKAIPGVVADVVDRSGNPVPPGTGGFLAIQGPWPAMFRTVYKDDERYRKYWETIPGMYSAGDLAVKDREGYIMVLGRADDIIIVAGHNIGTAEVESALVSHHAVAEAAVIGKPDPERGNAIKAFVILRQGNAPSERLTAELVHHVRLTLGPIAIPSEIAYVEKLPKTRSGKIMRRVLKAQELGVDPGDISTLED